MMVDIINTVPETLQLKLQSLLSFLKKVTTGFDAIAEEVDNANLKMALIALAVESRQYAKEITNHLQKINAAIPLAYTDQLWEQIEVSIHEQAGMVKGSEILILCNNCEKYFRKLYEDILQESVPCKNLESIITYQLYAAECAFMKIRLLNTFRFNQ